MSLNNLSKFLFTSERLGFRNWQDADLDAMAEISADPVVMEFFSSPQSKEYTSDLIKRMQDEFLERNHCYFAVEVITTGEFIGFIGLHLQTFESELTPFTDIGWRLKKSVWNCGYATEGALRCLKYGFEDLSLKEIYSITPALNLKSEHIMKKIGMIKQHQFIFPLLSHDERLKTCVLYKIQNPKKRLVQ